MIRLRFLPVLGLLAIVVLALGACSSSPTPTASAADGGGGGGGGGGADTVTISGTSFGDDITVAAGTVVTFQNDDDFEHSVTNGTDGEPAEDAAFDEDVEGGESVDITFDEAGTFDVTCRYHPAMHMTVTVE